MLNKAGVLAVLDRGITLNWEDGPTLHRITAQVRFHTATSATSQLMRLAAAHRQDEDALVFVQDEILQSHWSWREMNLPEDPPDVFSYWVAQLTVTNRADYDLYIDTLDVIRIDRAFHGQFNLGAPTGLWQCADQSPRGKFVWETWSQSTSSTGGFTRSAELLVQPMMSNRSRPPAVMVRAVDLPNSVARSSAPAEMALEISGERFERLAARNRLDGQLLHTGASLMSCSFIIASGDDATELHEMEFALPE